MLKSTKIKKGPKSSLGETIFTIFFFFFFLIFKHIFKRRKNKKIIIKNSRKSSLPKTIFKSTLTFDITLKLPYLVL
jgi:hypothetical protein